MYNINLVRYALLNQFDDLTIQKIHNIIDYSLEIIQDGELLYNFKEKDMACRRLIDLIITKSAYDVPSLGDNDRQLINLVLENKALFSENDNVLGDIKEKAKLFDKTVFEFETIEDYKAAIEEFIMNDVDEIEHIANHSTDMENALVDNGAASGTSVDESDETPNLNEVSEMLDEELDTSCDMEHREMLNGKELPTKGQYAIVERTLGIGATDWHLWKKFDNIYSDLGTAIDLKPSNYCARGWFSNEYEVVNLADPTWKQSLIENDENEYFIMKRELIRGGTDATDWEIDSDIFETWSEAKCNMHEDYGDYQFIIASRPKEKEEKKVDTRRRIFNFGD